MNAFLMAKLANKTEGRLSRTFLPGALALLVSMTAAGAAHAQTDNPILVELRSLLQAAVRPQTPDVIWELKGNELSAQFKTREFTLYSISPSGSIAAQAHQETGPDNGGFILRVRVFSSWPASAAQFSGEGRQAYWRTSTALYTLRANSDLTSTLPEPKLLVSEAESQPSYRPEFQDVSYATLLKLTELEIDGLIQSLCSNRVMS